MLTISNSNFPNPLSPKSEKDEPSFGKLVAEAIIASTSEYREKRNAIFASNRAYAEGKQSMKPLLDMMEVDGQSVYTNISIKAGMYANVMFGVSEGDQLNINKNALVTVQGKNYVFVKQSPTVFARREINVGPQTGDRIIVYNGLHNGDAIATAGVMQLKGLSFGY